MKEGTLAVWPGKPSTPLLPPPLPPARARSGSGPVIGSLSRTAYRDLAVSSMLVGEERGRRACQHACHPACWPAGTLARRHACIHSCMNAWRKACRVALPPPFVEGLADNGADVRLVLDQQELEGAVLGGYKGKGLIDPSFSDCLNVEYGLFDNDRSGGGLKCRGGGAV